MTVDSIWMAVAALILCVLFGMVIGAVVGIAIYDRATSRMARFMRTGNPAKASHKPGETAVPGGEFQGVSLERQAQERAYARVVDTGADEFMKLQPALTREAARTKARDALEAVGAFKAGAAGA